VSMALLTILKTRAMGYSDSERFQSVSGESMEKTAVRREWHVNCKFLREAELVSNLMRWL